MYYEPTGKFDLNAYQFYIKHANKHKHILEAIHNTIINGKAQWTVRLKDNNYQFRLLDVGSGPGQLTSSVLKLLLNVRGINNPLQEKSQKSNIFVYCVDPKEEVMDLLVKRLEQEGLNELINIKFIKQKIETWFSQNSSNGSIPIFDIILCSHTLYYIEDWYNLIDDFNQFLMEGGQLSIVLASKETELYHLREKLILELRGTPLVHLRFGEDVEEVLKKKNMWYETEVKKSSVTFTSEESTEFSLGCLENLDTVSNVLGFLFGYDPLALKEKKVFPQIKTFINSRICGNGLILTYKDKIFWTTKNAS